MNEFRRGRDAVRSKLEALEGDQETEREKREDGSQEVEREEREDGAVTVSTPLADVLSSQDTVTVNTEDMANMEVEIPIYSETMYTDTVTINTGLSSYVFEVVPRVAEKLYDRGESRVYSYADARTGLIYDLDGKECDPSKVTAYDVLVLNGDTGGVVEKVVWCDVLKGEAGVFLMGNESERSLEIKHYGYQDDLIGVVKGNFVLIGKEEDNG